MGLRQHLFWKGGVVTGSAFSTFLHGVAGGCGVGWGGVGWGGGRTVSPVGVGPSCYPPLPRTYRVELTDLSQSHPVITVPGGGLGPGSGCGCQLLLTTAEDITKVVKFETPWTAWGMLAPDSAGIR